MGEAQFVQYTVNSPLDVEVISAGLPAQTAKAGELAVAAVQEQTQAALAGDEAGVAAAQEKLAQALDSLQGLGKVKAQLNAFAAKV